MKPIFAAETDSINESLDESSSIGRHHLLKVMIVYINNIIMIGTSVIRLVRLILICKRVQSLQICIHLGGLCSSTLQYPFRYPSRVASPEDDSPWRVRIPAALHDERNRVNRTIQDDRLWSPNSASSYRPTAFERAGINLFVWYIDFLLKYWPAVLCIALLIILLSLPILLIKHRSAPPICSASKPLWLRILFVFDPAIEFPLIYAFHPVTLAYPSPSTLIPYLNTEQLAIQIGILYTVELIFQKYVLRFIDISTKREDSLIHHDKLNWRVNFVGKAKDDDGDELAKAVVFDFMRPRGALLLGVALLGIPSALTQHVGRLHPTAIVGWLVLQQIFDIEA